MAREIPQKVRDAFVPSTREGVVILEAYRILRRESWDATRARFLEIQFGDQEPFMRRDANVWELQLGMDLAEEWRSQFEAELKAERELLEATEQAAGKKEE
jgi:hypothetical protein